MHATHRIDVKNVITDAAHWSRESYHEGPHQADITENPIVEVNAVKNFLKNIKAQCYL